jgi:hypothetical protein
LKTILIEVKIQKIMPLFCKQCNERRYPIFQTEEKTSFWLCEKCENFVDAEDVIIREWTKEEKDKQKSKLKEFEKSTASIPKEGMVRRKGVN